MLDELIRYARQCGADGAACMAAADIVVDPQLAERCINPRCGHYGLSRSCPPHVGGPEALQQTLAHYRRALFFKIDVPADLLLSDERRQIFRLLHETAAGIERFAAEMGFAKAQAYAGGSCKAIFCDDHCECGALSAAGRCRHPLQARPSMSGFGIDVAKLFDTAGWTMRWQANLPDTGTIAMASVCALVLID